jgi:rare lipoprotein A
MNFGPTPTSNSYGFLFLKKEEGIMVFISVFNMMERKVVSSKFLFTNGAVAFRCSIGMNNTTAINHTITFGQAAYKKTLGPAMRKIVAVALFVLAGFLTIGSNLDLAFAKSAARRVASRMREVKSKGQFHLLNIYNTIKATNPSLVTAMNHATTGLASWYGGMFHGRKTAMGTTYNMYAMTAAHRSLPLGTWVKVTNDRNGKSAVVQVTDRGPYVANRIMDLSYAAAQKLGYANAGTTSISMKVLGHGYASAEEAQQAADQQATDQQVASQGTDQADITSIIPASFSSVSTRTDNVTSNSSGLLADAAGSMQNMLADAITTLTGGTPATAVASIFG